MSFGVTELVIILVIVVLLFGTTKIKSLGTDLGSAIKGFRRAITDDTSNEISAESKVEQKESSAKDS